MGTSTAVSPLGRAAAWANAPDMEKREFLVFRVGGIDFGMDACKVQELRHYGSLTCIVDGDRLVKGVVSLRGRVMPLVDLRSHFSTSPLLYDELTDVIVANVGGRSVCIVVDAIDDVIALAPNQVQTIPDAGTLVSPGSLLGTIEWKQGPLILMDIDRVLLGPKTDTPPRLAA